MKRKPLITCLSLSWLLTASWLAAAGNEADFLGDWRKKMSPLQPRGYVCGHTAKPLFIDGKATAQEAWDTVAWTEDFVDIEGDAKPKPHYRTRAKMLWDETHFYVFAEIESPHVWATLTEHDAVIFADPDFEVFIDPNGDSHQYYEFEINALNTGWDLFLPKPYISGGKADNSWEIPGLKTAVHVRGTLNDASDKDQGWDVEIAIPWKSMAEHAGRPIPPAEGDQWRMGYSHVEWQIKVEEGKYVKLPKAPEYNWIWSAQGIVDMHRPERWGYVQFTRQIPASVTVRPDATRPVRDFLQEVFYAQLDHFKKNNRYAASLAELAVSVPTDAPLEAAELKLTPTGFEGRITLKAKDGQAAQTWIIDETDRVRPAESKTASRVTPGVRWWSEAVEAALTKAGGNRPELDRALSAVPMAQREGMAFLIQHMPAVDLRALRADFLLENVDLAYTGLAEAPWKEKVSSDLFLNDILPYASLNEKRDGGRRRLRELALPLIKACTTPGDAAQVLNREFFPLMKVKYSTQRRRPDQSSLQTLESGMATCTGLSILLVDVCRAVGIPARVAGTPMWTNLRGNHTWTEIWDGEWHFTGACEPDKKGLDRGWFVGDASKAKADVRQHAIYASSYKNTGLSFPLIWDEQLDWVGAVNVTERYTKLAPASSPPKERAQVLVRVLEKEGGKRVAAKVSVTDASDAAFVLEGTSRDESADLNNILPFSLEKDHAYVFTLLQGDQKITRQVRTKTEAEQTLTLTLQEKAATLVPTTSGQAVADLRAWLALDRDQRSALEGTAFAQVPLTKADAAAAQAALWKDHEKTIRETQAEAMKAKVIELEGKSLAFDIERFGDKDKVPSGGRSLFISMHGGGGAPPQVNTSQWRNQVKLGEKYRPAEGIYLAPRAPTDTWNLWHQGHIDALFYRLISNLIVLEHVNPNRIFLMGYSAGGDGVYQLAPRMADSFAAASMMAGHPNEASPRGLRNLPFSIQVGANDGAFKRNDVAGEWGKKLAALRADDPQGYEHFVDLPAGKGHWMDLEDRKAIPWMEKFTRKPLPEKIVWFQDDVTHDRFYWLALPPGKATKGLEIRATRTGQTISLSATAATPVIVNLNDSLVDLDQSISVTFDAKTVFTGIVPRTIANLRQTLASRGDPDLVFSAAVTVP